MDWLYVLNAKSCDGGLYFLLDEDKMLEKAARLMLEMHKGHTDKAGLPYFFHRGLPSIARYLFRRL